MSTVDREAEIAELAAQYGAPLRQRCTLDVSQATHEWWSTDKVRRRDGEVVLFLLRRNRKLLLHTKDFYPHGVMRAPSGGIKPREAVIAAVHREALEETGLQVSIERFLALVEFEFCRQGLTIPYPSYSFLLREVEGELTCMDPDERIAGFGEAPVADLPTTAERLEKVPPSWQDWGQFRAIPHRLVARLMGVGE